MGNFPSTLLHGFRWAFTSAIGLLFAPLLACLAGAMTATAAAFSDGLLSALASVARPDCLILLSFGTLLAVPFWTICDIWGFLIGLAIVGTLLRFAMYEEWRIDCLLAVAVLTSLQVFMHIGGKDFPAWLAANLPLALAYGGIWIFRVRRKRRWQQMAAESHRRKMLILAGKDPDSPDARL